MKKAYLTQKTVEWYLNHLEVYELKGTIDSKWFEEIEFLIAVGLSGKEFEGVNTGIRGSTDETFYCHFGPLEAWFELNKRNRTV